MPSKPRTSFDGEAPSDGNESKIRTRKSERQLSAEESLRTRLERNEQIRKAADKDGAEHLFFAHI